MSDLKIEIFDNLFKTFKEIEGTYRKAFEELYAFMDKNVTVEALQSKDKTAKYIARTMLHHAMERISSGDKAEAFDKITKLMAHNLEP